MKYIVCKYFNKKGMDGDFSLKRGSTCNSIGSIIFHNNRPICFTTSQDAFDFFARNDDDNGKERFDLSHQIIDHIKELVIEYNEAYANKEPEEEIEDTVSIFYNEIRTMFPKFLKGNLDVLTVDFYNAEIDDLKEIIKLWDKTEY